MSGLRSLLFVPANRPDMLAKAATYGADALILDLEDSVPLDAKPRARELAREYLGSHSTGPGLYVRVNSEQTGMLEADLDAVVTAGLTAIRLPKTESAQTIGRVSALLTDLERSRGLPQNSIHICPSLESARGVWFAYEILSASPRILAASCGTAQDGDLQADLGYTWTPEGEEVLYVRSRVLLAAKAAGVQHVLDGTYAKFRDPEGLRICCEAARRLGYRGKSCIHPSQVDIVNRIFAPTEREIEYYRRVIVAFESAIARGSAATAVDGTMIDYAMVETAKRVLAWAEGVKGKGE